MKIRALTSFAGSNLSMHKGEVRECAKDSTIKDLLSCKYVEEIKVSQSRTSESKEDKEPEDEDKPSDSSNNKG